MVDIKRTFVFLGGFVLNSTACFTLLVKDAC